MTFLKFEDTYYVTRAINADHIVYVTLLDAGWSSLRPVAQVVMVNGDLIPVRIPTSDIPVQDEMADVVRAFFDQIIEATP